MLDMKLFSVFSISHINQVYTMYRGDLVGGHAQQDAVEAGGLAPDLVELLLEAGDEGPEVRLGLLEDDGLAHLVQDEQEDDGPEATAHRVQERQREDLDAPSLAPPHGQSLEGVIIEPRVAMLSYATGDSGKGTDVEAVIKATEIARKLRPDLMIEGPLQYDAAVDESVARTKMPDSEVAGRATVFIFPDLNTGNNTYKAVQRSARAVAVGPVLQGLNKPVNDLSRGCTVTDIVNTVAITAIQAQNVPPV